MRYAHILIDLAPKSLGICGLCLRIYNQLVSFLAVVASSIPSSRYLIARDEAESWPSRLALFSLMNHLSSKASTMAFALSEDTKMTCDSYVGCSLRAFHVFVFRGRRAGLSSTNAVRSLWTMLSIDRPCRSILWKTLDFEQYSSMDHIHCASFQ